LKDGVIMKAEDKRDFDKEAAADENPGVVYNDVADAIIRRCAYVRHGRP
jgi:hypothetical protein